MTVFDGLLSRAAGYRQIMGGTVIVNDAGRRLIGSVVNLRLEGISAGGASASLLITEGSFDLPLLTGAAAERMMYCFVEDALAKRCQM